MFESLLERIATALRDAGIPYMVIGGQAVLLYGEPRLTKDIDITLGAGIERLPAVLDLARRLELQLPDDAEGFARQTMVLPCSDPSTGIRVDLILSYSPYEQLAISRSKPVKIGSVEVQFASVEDLIILKIVAGRPRDLEDVRGVVLRNPDFDRAYVKRWLKDFSAALTEDFVGRFDRISTGS